MVQFSSLYGARLDRELHAADSTNLFTTARRQNAVNEAQEEWARVTECLERRSSITITGGTAEYNLNSTTVIPGGDFVEWAKTGPEFRYTDASSQVTVLAGDDLPRRTVDWLHRYEPGWQISTVASSVKQTPSVWYERIDGGNRYLGFYPVPSTGSSASAECFVTYQARPSAMASDTSEPFTVNSTLRADLRPYHQALVHYAASQLEKLRPDEQASASQLQRFIGYLTAYLQEHRIKTGTHLTTSRSYFRRAARQDDRPKDPRT